MSVVIPKGLEMEQALAQLAVKILFGDSTGNVYDLDKD